MRRVWTIRTSPATSGVRLLHELLGARKLILQLHVGDHARAVVLAGEDLVGLAVQGEDPHCGVVGADVGIDTRRQAAKGADARNQAPGSTLDDGGGPGAFQVGDDPPGIPDFTGQQRGLGGRQGRPLQEGQAGLDRPGQLGVFRIGRHEAEQFLQAADALGVQLDAGGRPIPVGQGRTPDMGGQPDVLHAGRPPGPEHDNRRRCGQRPVARGQFLQDQRNQQQTAAPGQGQVIDIPPADQGRPAGDSQPGHRRPRRLAAPHDQPGPQGGHDPDQRIEHPQPQDPLPDLAGPHLPQSFAGVEGGEGLAELGRIAEFAPPGQAHAAPEPGDRVNDGVPDRVAGHAQDQSQNCGDGQNPRPPQQHVQPGAPGQIPTLRGRPAAIR